MSMRCRITGDNLEDVFLDLGHAPPSNSLVSQAQLAGHETTYPLKCFVNPSNFYVQVDEFKPADSIFNEDYVYLSSMSSSMVEHARNYVEHITGRLNLDASNQVMEIASNDGYLLQHFKNAGIPCVGIEPSSGAAQFAIDKGIESIPEFFNLDFASKFTRERGAFDLVLGNNVLAHVPDLASFLAGVEATLADSGVATFEFPHLLNLIREVQFDMVYHEHFSYFSLYAIEQIVSQFGLRLFDVEEVATHGGSYRIYLCKSQAEFARSENVESTLQREKEAGLLNLSTYSQFQHKVDSLKYNILETLVKLKKSGASIAGYGAAAKGSTTFNYCGIRPDLVSFVTDRAPSKIGKFLPGCHIPIVEEDHLKAAKPDYIIIIPWNIQPEIASQLDYARSWNAQFITLIPEVRIF